jgi:pimeloyl-ACP methyl ester carboxylesterase
VRTRPSPPATALLVIAVLLALTACDRDSDTDVAGDAQEVPVPDMDLDTDADGPVPDLRADPDCFDLVVVVDDRHGSGDGPITCGHVAVPLRHDDPDGATIDLAVITIAGSATRDHDRPLLVLGGGPGEVMVETFLGEPLLRDAFDVGPDLIVMDQRGVGASVPALECPEVFDEPDNGLTPEQEVDTYIANLGDCRERLADEGIDLGAFHHLANAADVDVVRRALGHDEIDLRGTSYGTQVALLATQMQPHTIGGVILSSPVDPTRNWVELAPAGVQRALDEVVAACDQDEGCAQSFGDLDERIQTTVERLAEDPEQVTVELPELDPVTLSYTPAKFLGGLSLLFYVPDGAGALPALAAAAAAGELEPLAELTVALEQQLVGGLSVGMQYSMLCTGEGALVTEDSLRAATEGGLVEEHWLPNNVIAGDHMVEACDGWDVEPAYDPEQVVIDHEVPTLIVTGELDHVTPPALGRSVDERLANSTLIEVPATGHAPLEVLGTCGRQIAAEFLRDPTSPPDAACATERELVFGGDAG